MEVSYEPNYPQVFTVGSFGGLLRTRLSTGINSWILWRSFTNMTIHRYKPMAPMEVSYENPTFHKYKQLASMEVSYEPNYPQVLTFSPCGVLLRIWLSTLYKYKHLARMKVSRRTAYTPIHFSLTVPITGDTNTISIERLTVVLSELKL